MNPILQLMVQAALEAGAEIETIYGAGCATEVKEDGSPVTEADRRAEAIILRRLRTAYAEISGACRGRGLRRLHSRNRPAFLLRRSPGRDEGLHQPYRRVHSEHRAH
jgi:hypothetical protein